MTPDERERYSRHLLLREIGGQGQQKLLASRVLVVGAGGLGAPILQYLAAAGVGTIGIADDDFVALSNLQRQVIFKTSDVGRAKVDAARDFVAELNGGITINAHQCLIDEGNAAEIISAYDLVIEGVDNFATRYTLNRACLNAGIPFVSCAIGRFDGQLSVFKPYMARGTLPCYRCLVPHEPPREDQTNCAQEGVLGVIAGVMGTLAATEAIKELLQIGESLAGRLLIYDAMAPEIRTVVLPADPLCPDCS